MRWMRLLTALCLLVTGCGWGSGSAWVQQPLEEERSQPQRAAYGAPGQRNAPRAASRTLGAHGQKEDRPGGGAPGASGANEGDKTGGGGKVLGTFRNTYYDFPREGDHKGEAVSLMSASCETIAKVPRTFHDAVCVQGSGALKRGGTVSFAKRDCACAETCPRTGQKICFEALDAAQFPYGRGAAGKPITPLRSVAADTAVLPMGTVLYIPELDGAPRGETGESLDGCFVVEDRGLRVKGEHVDIFTGNTTVTAILNDKVPSNQGVTVVVSAPRCAHLAHR
jgi:3D (Asp-Asp-Asp) domain-containing protein